MTTEHRDPHADSDPLHVEEPTLDDTNESQHDRGRIGYGRHERRSSWLLGVALIAIVLALGGYQWYQGRGDDTTSSDSHRVQTPKEGQPAPDFTLKTLDNATLTLSDYKGKVVVLNFWGSWCAPCREEMPAFQSYSASAPDDVQFIGVSSKQDNDENARKFVKEYGVTYPIVRDTEGGRAATGQVAIDYDIRFYPMTYIINKDGKISTLLVKAIGKDELDTFIEKARKETAGRGTQPLAAVIPDGSGSAGRRRPARSLTR